MNLKGANSTLLKTCLSIGQCGSFEQFHGMPLKHVGIFDVSISFRKNLNYI